MYNDNNEFHVIYTIGQLYLERSSMWNVLLGRTKTLASESNKDWHQEFS